MSQWIEPDNKELPEMETLSNVKVHGTHGERIFMIQRQVSLYPTRTVTSHYSNSFVSKKQWED